MARGNMRLEGESMMLLPDDSNFPYCFGSIDTNANSNCPNGKDLATRDKQFSVTPSLGECEPEVMVGKDGQFQHIFDVSYASQGITTSSECFGSQTTIQLQAPPTQVPRPQSGVAEPFPSKLHRLLQDAYYEDTTESIIQWLPHGRAFRISNKKKLESDLLGRYFHHSNWRSFSRQLCLYNFKRIAIGRDKGTLCSLEDYLCQADSYRIQCTCTTGDIHCLAPFQSTCPPFH